MTGLEKGRLVLRTLTRLQQLAELRLREAQLTAELLTEGRAFVERELERQRSREARYAAAARELSRRARRG